MIGNLKTESDLARFVKKQVNRPDVLPTPVPLPAIAIVKTAAEGPITDADFPQPPGDRTLGAQEEVVEEATVLTLMIRLGGAWRAF